MKKLLLKFLLIYTMLFGLAAEAESNAVPDAYVKGEAAIAKGDYETALRALEPLAEQGEVNSQFRLGVMYVFGLGVAQDYEAAFKWYNLAAEQGHIFAQLNMGMMYWLGRGVPKDLIYAHAWLSIAFANENEIDVQKRGIMHRLNAVEKEMTPAQIVKARDLAQRLEGEIKK